MRLCGDLKKKSSKIAIAWKQKRSISRACSRLLHWARAKKGLGAGNLYVLDEVL